MTFERGFRRMARILADNFLLIRVIRLIRYIRVQTYPKRKTCTT